MSRDKYQMHLVFNHQFRQCTALTSQHVSNGAVCIRHHCFEVTLMKLSFSGSGTAVEHSSHHPKVKGWNTTVTTGTEIENVIKLYRSGKHKCPRKSIKCFLF
jgi:hypothetical protein